MLEASSTRHRLGLSQTLCGPKSHICLVSTFFKTEAHQTRSQGAQSSLEGWEDGRSSQAQALTGGDGYATGLHNFPFASLDISASSLVARCGWLGMKHYLYKKNKSKTCCPGDETSTHSVGSRGKWVPGYAQASRLQGNTPRARALHRGPLWVDIWECVFVINSKSGWTANPKWQKQWLANPWLKGWVYISGMKTDSLRNSL